MSANVCFIRISGRDGLLGVALREGLYYVDEVTISETVLLAHETSEREAWLWHRRLEHPSWSGEEQCDTLSWLRYNSEESCPNQNTTSVGAQEQSSLNISAIEDTVLNLISEVEEPTLIEVPKKYVLPEANQGCPLHQFDVKNAFLHGELKEEVYMEAPPGFSQHFKHEEVCKLKKSLYGLKQSPRAWFRRFTLAMKKYGYKQSNSDHTLFLRHRGDRVTCLIIYVDDMIITENDKSEIKKLKEGLCVEFEMKDLGNLRSASGYFSVVGGNLVTWKSKMQKVVSLSRVEAKFRGIAKGLAEALWIRKLVSEIGFSPKESIRIMSDNKATIQISENPVQHDRTKHVEVDRHFIKKKLEAGIIKLPFVKSEDQLADILTKAVGMVILHKCLNKLNFGDPTIQLEEEC
uniref:Putative reverse transcriptase, RNA-dependent DNA polymerase n=1 Tax=Tanacetum cinerariifolium TaxID=118510 RepID=A0A6L2JRP3_TANCI|nr:putative reverse transcriptase, RNA-dependent DNA polymerase [Tanacetum cinerariifolium]